MRPTRRVLLAIALLSLALFGGVVTVWIIQARALAEALVADLQASLARTIERDPKPAATKHENGYACVAGMVDVTPRDLGLFELKNGDAFRAVIDGGVVSEEVQQKLTSLAPWAASLRACGDSAHLRFVDGVTPFTTSQEPRGERAGQVILALGRLTRLEAKLLTGEGQWEPLVERCAGTLEVALDRSHLNLLGAMIAGAAVRQLTPACGLALQHVNSEAVARRFAALPARLAANHEFMEEERLLMSLGLYRWVLSDEQRAKVPVSDFMFDDSLQNVVQRLASARFWGRYDRAMRNLAATADLPGPGRRDASGAVNDAFKAWWLPDALGFSPDYDKFFLRNEDTMGLLRLLESLASGGTKALPAQVVRTEAGLELTDSKGEKVLVAVPAPP